MGKIVPNFRLPGAAFFARLCLSFDSEIMKERYDFFIKAEADLPLLERLESMFYQLAGELGKEAYSEYSPEIREYLSKNLLILYGVCRVKSPIKLQKLNSHHNELNLPLYFLRMSRIRPKPERETFVVI